MHAVLVEKFIASFRNPPERLILDFDATDDRVHGHQRMGVRQQRLGVRVQIWQQRLGVRVQIWAASLLIRPDASEEAPHLFRNLAHCFRAVQPSQLLAHVRRAPHR